MKISLKAWQKHVVLVGFFLAVFISAVAVWYAPVQFKGFSAEPMTEQTVLARNYALTGQYAMENDLNVALAPELIKTQAHPSYAGNKFNAISYAVVFKLFGWQDWNNLVLISVIIYALSLVIFSLSVYLLFGLPVAVVFSAVYILLPFNATTARAVNFYEISQLYFSIFVLLYFWGKDRKNNLVYLVAAGIFLVMACLAKEAFFIFLPILFIWLWWRKKNKELLTMFIPVGILLLIFWLPAMFAESNDYVKLFVATDKTKNHWSDFRTYGHIFPDPYTFHFDRQFVVDQLNSDLTSKNTSWLYKIDRLKVSKNMGVRSINPLEWFIVGTNNLITHISGYLDLAFTGGPLIFILMLAGFWVLKRRDKALYGLFIFWFIGSLILWSYVTLVIRNHLMDSGWIIALLVALALTGFPSLLKDYFKLDRVAKPMAGFIIILVLYSLVLVNHAGLGHSYDSNHNLSLSYLGEKMKASSASSTDVIAVGDFYGHADLNYLSGKSDVYFAPETIMRLMKENKLQDAFDKFNVKYVAGYDDAVSAIIVSSTKAINISSWPKPEKINQATSYDQNWLMNIIK